jgi:glycosyltransferase involved in cell wall biosynthesis
MPKVSAVMPAHDVAPYIGEAISAILDQTFTDFELIVVDDGSSDGTADIARSFDDPRVKVMRTEHLGAPHAQNLGIASAVGEYIARPDGDDVVMPALFERQVQVLDSQPSVAAVGVWVRRFGGKEAYYRTPTSPAAVRRALRRGTNPITQPVMIRSSALREVGGFRDVRWEDWDLWIRLAANWDLCNIPEPLGLWRYRADSRSHSQQGPTALRHNFEVWRATVSELGFDPMIVWTVARSLLRTGLRSMLPKGEGPPALDLGEAVRTLPAVSVVVPTIRRIERLRACLGGVTDQDPPPEEVIVVRRDDDEDTREFLEDWRAAAPEVRREAIVGRPGLVHALVEGTDAARSEVIAYLDDDCVPREGWLEEIRRGFLDPTVGAAGGRFVDHEDGREVEGRSDDVGRITWYGRTIGNHDKGSNRFGDVEFLPGTNWALRRGLSTHDRALRHTRNGLALANELDACLTVKRLGWRVLYSPFAVVDHYTTSFRDPDLGSRVAGEDVVTSAANYTYALLKYLPAWRRPAFLVYAFGGGSASLPGPMRAIAEYASDRGRATAMFRRIPAVWSGRLEGLRMYRMWRAAGGYEALGLPGPRP